MKISFFNEQKETFGYKFIQNVPYQLVKCGDEKECRILLYTLMVPFM